MKIVHALGWYFPESIGGMEVYVRALCRRQQSEGHEVWVVVPDDRSDQERRYQDEGIPVYRYPIARHATRQESQGRVPIRGTELLRSWLRQQRPDILHVHFLSNCLGLSEIQAARDCGSKVVVTCHTPSLGFICQRGTLMQWGERICDGICQPAKCAACALQQRGLPKGLARLLGQIPPALGRRFTWAGRLGTGLGMSDAIAHRREKQRQLFQQVDRFVILADWAWEIAAANGAPLEKLALNRLGVRPDLGRKKPGPTDQPTRLPLEIGYLGRFDQIKGVQDLARACASIPREVPIRVEFRGPLEQQHPAALEQARSLVGDDPRFRFEPAVRSDRAAEVLAGYDLLCCPSVCLEGGPTVALEAMAIGTPVIGSQVGGLAEMVRDEVDGRLFEPGDWRAIAQIIRHAASDPGKTVDRWRSALLPVRTMDQVADDYRQIYSEIVADPTALEAVN